MLKVARALISVIRVVSYILLYSKRLSYILIIPYNTLSYLVAVYPLHDMTLSVAPVRGRKGGSCHGEREGKRVRESKRVRYLLGKQV